ncbi:glucosidase 2 subunit beta [Latimeria chalumnae]|uniref:glucosidase 2 subunit beta n=1 Tax=Latimeria chalumnae TaxID=7897 RepID=UPI00313BFA38
MLLLSLLLSFLSCSAVEVKRPRGVSLSNLHFYDESKPFTCLDGSRTISADRVNDDYCDCRDGSDEPGTSACPNGNFHCTNAGFRPQYISSSRVNDGICDCCDTTDEYNSGAVCKNTCKEMGLRERETLQQLAEITKEGFRLKQQLIEEGKKGREEKQKQLVELQENKKSIEGRVETLRAAKEAAEEPEKEAKDAHQKAWEEQQAVRKLEKEKQKAAGYFLELDDDEDGFVSVAELQSHAELDTDGDGALSESEAQALLGGAAQADATVFQDLVWSAIKDKYKSEALPDAPSPEEIPIEEGTDSHPEIREGQPPREEEEDEEEDGEDEDDDDTEEDHKGSQATLTEKKAEDEEEKMPPYDEATQTLIDAAQKARDEFDDAEKSLREMEDSIRRLEKEISFDFGPEGEFAYLYNQCYELTTNEYIYRLCPFSRVSQKPKQGGSETNLGSWGSWAGPEENKFSVMKYEHGTGCWQGPSRSTMVKLTCGKETVILSTSEPSRCEYLMEFTTPAVCQEPKIPEVTDHDEL